MLLSLLTRATLQIPQEKFEEERLKRLPPFAAAARSPVAETATSIANLAVADAGTGLGKGLGIGLGVGLGIWLEGSLALTS